MFKFCLKSFIIQSKQLNFCNQNYSFFKHMSGMKKSEATDKPHDLFVSGHNYANFRPTYPDSLYETIVKYQHKFITQTSSNEKRICVDVGCGTGQASVALSRDFDEVIAIDASLSQLQSAIQSPKVVYKIGSAEHIPTSDHVADMITVAQALHWFQLDTFFAECKRVLRPGGTLAAWTYGLIRLENKQAEDIIMDYHMNVMGPYWDAKRLLVDQRYIHITLPFHDFQRVESSMEYHMTLQDLYNYLGTWSSLKTYKQTHPQHTDPRDELLNKLLKCYSSEDATTTRIHVAFDLTILLSHT